MPPNKTKYLKDEGQDRQDFIEGHLQAQEEKREGPSDPRYGQGLHRFLNTGVPL